MAQDKLKLAVARAAQAYVATHLPAGAILGVGTGSTANFFIDELVAIKDALAKVDVGTRKEVVEVPTVDVKKP